MNGAYKGIQGSPKLTLQSDQTSQTASGSEQAHTLTKLPFRLAISPREFCMLKAAYHGIGTQQDQAITCKK